MMPSRDQIHRVGYGRDTPPIQTLPQMVVMLFFARILRQCKNLPIVWGWFLREPLKMEILRIFCISIPLKSSLMGEKRYEFQALHFHVWTISGYVVLWTCRDSNSTSPHTTQTRTMKRLGVREKARHHDSCSSAHWLFFSFLFSKPAHRLYV